MLPILSPLKENCSTFKLSGRLKEKRKHPDVYGQLPQGVKHSVCSFHPAYHKRLFFHQTVVRGDSNNVQERKQKKMRNWKNNSETVLMLAREFFLLQLQTIFEDQNKIHLSEYRYGGI